MSVTVATAARIARVSAATIRTWCRRGTVAAVKVDGRWMVSVRSLAAHAPLHMPTDRPRAGEMRPAKTGRAARVRRGNCTSVLRRHVTLIAWANAGMLTSAGYLTDVIGAGKDFVESYDTPFGTAVATAWRAFYGCDPKKTGLARTLGGLLVRVFVYPPREAWLLDAAAEVYPRTAALLAA